MTYEQEDRQEVERRFDKLEERINSTYSVVVAIGVAFVAGCVVFTLGASLKTSAVAAICGGLCVEIGLIKLRK